MNIETIINKSLFPQDIHVLLDLLMSNEWPEAAPAFLICEDSENDKTERAEGILGYIGRNLTNNKILDFGCGEGHLTLKASETAIKSIGYDIVKSGGLAWELGGETVELTTDFAKVTAHGPYDFIVLYDVLDHCKNPIEALEQIKLVCGPQTKIFVRCHPWISRHGSHLYKQLNKAWAHIFFTEDELAKMGFKTEFIFKYFLPMKTHDEWFAAAGLKKVSSDIIKTIVEPFFRKPEFAPRIPAEFNGKLPEFQMSQTFNDYILTI